MSNDGSGDNVTVVAMAIPLLVGLIVVLLMLTATYGLAPFNRYATHSDLDQMRAQLCLEIRPQTNDYVRCVGQAVEP